MIKDWILSFKPSLKSKQNIDHWMSVSALKPLLSAQLKSQFVRTQCETRSTLREAKNNFGELCWAEKSLSQSLQIPSSPRFAIFPFYRGEISKWASGVWTFLKWHLFCWVPAEKFRVSGTLLGARKQAFQCIHLPGLSPDKILSNPVNLTVNP